MACNTAYLGGRASCCAANERLLVGTQLFANGFGVVLDGGERHPFDVVRKVGARAGARRAVLGPVSRALAFGSASRRNSSTERSVPGDPVSALPLCGLFELS